jgi:hypothetical protein
VLIEKLTDLNKNKVGVRPEDIRFPTGCLLCDEQEAAVIRVNFTRTLYLFFIGAIETLPVDVPLCAKHQEQYRRGTRRITVIQIVSVVCSFACFSLLYVNPIPRSGLTIGQTIAVSFAGFFLLCAYFSIGFRCRILPLRVNVRNYDRILSYGAYPQCNT